MKKLTVVLLVGIIVVVLMCVEYLYIMNNIRPYRGQNGLVYIEIFGQVNEYSADPISNLENF